MAPTTVALRVDPPRATAIATIDRQVHQRRVEAVLDVLDRIGAESAAELACGAGAVLRSVSGARPGVGLTGYEADERLVAYARIHAGPATALCRADFAAGDPLGRHDLVWSIDALHRLPTPVLALRAVVASLPVGGTWLVFEPNIWQPYVTYQRARLRHWGDGEDHFRPWRFVPQAKAAGFEVRAKRYLHAVPASVRRFAGPAARAERLVERLPMVAVSVVYELQRTA